MDEQIFTDSYGVHFDDSGIPYLHQQKDGQGQAALGGMKSPFKVVNRNFPPHRINPSTALLQPLPITPAGFLNNPLVDVYLPKPSIGIPPTYCIRVSEYECFEPLQKLANLGSPAGSPVRLWNGGKSKIEDELALTNLIPLTVLGWPQKSSDDLHHLLNFSRTKHRKFIVGVGEFEPALPSTVDLTQAYHDVLPMLWQLTPDELQIIGALFFRVNIKQMADNYYELNSSQ